METSLHVWTNMENDGNLIWLLVWNMNFIFHNIWDNPSHLTFLFFRGVETTVWNRNFMTFRILGMSSSHLTFIFFGGVGGLKPPTSNFSGDLDYTWLTINCMIINCTFNSYCGFQWLWWIKTNRNGNSCRFNRNSGKGFFWDYDPHKLVIEW